MDKYDIAIIGAGVCGAAIARILSKYDISVALLEKECDVSFGTSKSNSGIIHAGFHHNKKYLKTKLEVRGNYLFDELYSELDFPFKRCGIIVVAFNEEELLTLEKLYQQGLENGSKGIQMCSHDEMLELEPNLNPDIVGGLYAPMGGMIEPYRFVFSLVESAIENGVKLITNFKVIKAENRNDYFSIFSEDAREIKAKYVINSAGVFADNISEIFNAEKYEIKPRKGEYYILDKSSKVKVEKIIFPAPSPISKGILVIPTVEGTILLGPTAENIEDKLDTDTTGEYLEKIFETAKHLVTNISEKDIITSFAGIRPALDSGDFYIEESKIVKNFIHVSGIQSPGLTAAPAIAEYVLEILKNIGCELKLKNNFISKVEKYERIRDNDYDKIEELIKKNDKYGNIICRCENISEAEIVEAIKRGHVTLDGIKFFTRSGMGRCQGGFCSYKIIKIIMRETGLNYNEITKKGKNSEILVDKL